jgi:hypothetical protein
MSMPLAERLGRTGVELVKFANALRAAPCGSNATLKAEREGAAGQLDDRAAQCVAWLFIVERGPVAPEREAEMRASCDEWLRMVG